MCLGKGCGSQANPKFQQPFHLSDNQQKLYLVSGLYIIFLRRKTSVLSSKIKNLVVGALLAGIPPLCLGFDTLTHFAAH